MKSVKRIFRVKCDFCKEYIVYARQHTVIGFRMDSGRQINACGECIAKIGHMKLLNDNEGIDRFFDEAGIKID